VLRLLPRAQSIQRLWAGRLLYVAEYHAEFVALLKARLDARALEAAAATVGDAA
jgi:hypothetical protein